jgi:3-deoxy-D-manno-octulosonic-acid transferase
MARKLYTLLWWLALPFVPLRLAWRARREPGYRHAIGERLGRCTTPRPAGEVVWVHAVSLGETRAAAPLIERLLAKRPRATVLLTCMTASGREAGRAYVGGRVVQAWLPYDVPFAVRAFLRHWSPSAGLLMETELWPNLAHECRARGVPLFLVNARMSAKSAAGYARFSGLARPMLASLAGVAAQTDADARRLRELGAAEVAVAGNLKFDVAIAPAMRERGARMRERFGRTRRVLLCASTREGEEALLLDALARKPLPGDALVVLVPRHPQRFDEVAALLRSRGVASARRSADAPVGADVRIVLGDTMGEMLAYCAAADVAFVGGSLLPLGGQNLIEPIALGVPVLVGPHTFNFAEATERAVEAGAALRVQDADALVAQAAALLADDGVRARMREAALAFHSQHRGAAERLWSWLGSRLPSPPTPLPPAGGTGE